MKRKQELEHFVGRRYGDFTRLHKQLRIELPGKVLPPVPKKNKSDTAASSLLGRMTDGGGDSDASSLSSVSTMQPPNGESGGLRESMRNLTVRDHRRNLSTTSIGKSSRSSPRPSTDGASSPVPSPKSAVSAILNDIYSRRLTIIGCDIMARKPENLAESFPAILAT